MSPRKATPFRRPVRTATATPVNHTIAISFSVDNGPKVYIERIDIRRQHAHPRLCHSPRIRYRRRRPLQSCPDRARRAPPQQPWLLQESPHHQPARARRPIASSWSSRSRTSRPARSPCRGGYSTTEGFHRRSSPYTETNFIGRGQYVRLASPTGSTRQGWKATFTEPYFLGQRLAAGFDVFHQVNNQRPIRALSELDDRRDCQARHSDHRRFDVPAELFDLQSKITIPNTSSQPYDDCVGPDQTWFPVGPSSR